MKRLLLSTIVPIVFGALYFGTLQPADAAITDALTGSVGVTGLSDVTVSGAGLFSDAVPTNHSLSAPFNLFTLNPGGSCSGAYCSGNTVTETLTVSFTGLLFETFALNPLTLTGVYKAKYSGSELGCAVGDGKSPSSGETDCFSWTGAVDALGNPDANHDGKLLVTRAIGNTGATLALTFYNTSDWSISPTMTAQLIAAPVPEPASLAVLGFGLLSIGAVTARRQTR